ncbi:MAG: hypothetical protein P4L51_27490 [Puia sp.]|nr:hypothetical protein [Puia sp.]
MGDENSNRNVTRKQNEPKLLYRCMVDSLKLFDVANLARYSLPMDQQYVKKVRYAPTILLKGEVYFVGRPEFDASAVFSVPLGDLADDKTVRRFTRRASLIYEHREALLVSCLNTIYAIGNGFMDARCEKYDTIKDAWTPVPSCSGLKHCVSAYEAMGFIYTVGDTMAVLGLILRLDTRDEEGRWEDIRLSAEQASSLKRGPTGIRQVGDHELLVFGWTRYSHPDRCCRFIATDGRKANNERRMRALEDELSVIQDATVINGRLFAVNAFTFKIHVFGLRDRAWQLLSGGYLGSKT